MTDDAGLTEHSPAAASGQRSGVEAIKLPPNARIVASGLGFLEGPCAEGANHLLVASINRGVVYRISLDAPKEPELLFEAGGGPNGLATAPDGSVYVAQNGASVMTSRSKLPAAPTIQKWEGQTLSPALCTGVTAPSDCVIGPDGMLWFTDPADHKIFQKGKPGSLRAFDPTTGEVRTLLDGLAFPNGLAFGPTGSEIYVAETSARTVSRYQLTDKGLEADGWIAKIETGHPDGIALDTAGWLWVAGSTGHNIMAFDATGTLRKEVHLGEGVLVTSLCFGGQDRMKLYVTTPKGGCVIEIPALHPGLPLPAFRSHASSDPKRAAWA